MTTALDACHRARQAWQRTQDQLDIFSVLNAAADTDASHASPDGRCVEHAEPQSRRGPDGARAYASLTAASASRTGTGGTVAGASACSLTNEGEATT